LFLIMIIGLLFTVLRSLLIIFGSKKRGGFVFICSCCFLIPLFSLLYSEDFILTGGRSYVDSLGVSLVILSGWVSLLIFYSRYKILRFKELRKYFLFMVYFLIFILVLTFLVDDYLLFYFLFEISLIPTLIIIMGWGYQPERLQAGIYFIFYTLTASLPLLLAINYFLKVGGRLSFIL